MKVSVWRPETELGKIYKILAELGKILIRAIIQRNKNLWTLAPNLEWVHKGHIHLSLFKMDMDETAFIEL